tara:strand:+ start:1253 stop:1654 length:402 start_codon:yes stop_codon:yes gene_type:complete
MTEGICPSGWHIPSDGEFTELTDFLGGESVAGGKMKSTYGWNNEGNGSNSSGFYGLPGGFRFSGGFCNDGFDGYWWSASESGAYSWSRTGHHLRLCLPEPQQSLLRLFCSLRPGLKILNYSDAVARWQITSRA